MTKREIVDRLLSIYVQDDHAIPGAVRDFILDLAAPEEEMPETEMGDKAWFNICPWRHHGKNPLGLECSSLLCPHCVRNPKAKEKEKEPKEEEEKHPGVLANPGKNGEIEWCWCQKCYAHAAVVHDPFGDGEDWSYCKKCGVSFRLKRRAEEGK